MNQPQARTQFTPPPPVAASGVLAGETVLAAEQGAFKNLVNGPVLKASRWAMINKCLDPNLHRFSNAVGLFAGLTMGRETMDLLAGETVGGEKIDRDSVPIFLRPLHGVYKYNHFSDDPHDRYMAVADKWAPAMMGGFGAYAGSLLFGMSQPQWTAVQEAQKDLSKLTLDKAETVIKFRQAHPWRVLSGITSMFGSASGFGLLPGIHNFGSTLSAAFIGHVPRDKIWAPYVPGLSEFLSGNSRNTSYGPASELPRLQAYLLGNSEKLPGETLERVGNILQPWFGKDATPERIRQFADKLLAVRGKYFTEGKGVTDAEAATKELSALLSGTGFEKTLREIGLNPLNAAVGRNGFIEAFSRFAGSDAEMDKLEGAYKKAYASRNNLSYVFDKAAEQATRAHIHPRDKATLAFGTAIIAAGALGVGGLALQARKWHKQDNDALFKRPDDEEEQTPAAQVSVTKPPAPAKKKTDRMLGFLEMSADSLNSPETRGKHRAECALGMTVFGIIGMKLMEAATGLDYTGKAIAKENVPDYLHGIYKKLHYNAFSDHPRDKWMYVLHLAVPSVMATAGVLTASTAFFKQRTRALDRAEYIDDYEDKMTMAEAKPWTFLTATSSILATPAGNPFVPIPGLNYGMSLGTRYMLSSGNKVILPGLGEKWTGTTSRYAWGPVKLRDHMIKYAENNPADHAEQLEEMAMGILKPWFKDIKPQQIQAFVDKIEADRHRFLKNGGVPQESMKSLDKLLKSHFRGAGLEQTLREIGLDPASATLGANGWSGELAKKLGAKKELNEIHEEFVEKYADRVSALEKKTPLPEKSEPESFREKYQARKAGSPEPSLSA